MARNCLILTLCGCMVCVLGVAALSGGEEPADAKLQKLSNESRSRAEGMRVSVTVGDQTTKAKVHANPLLKYTDVPRLIDMATLWVWQDEGCPVALAKVEAYRRNEGTRWLYCFASASTGVIDAKWPGGRRFQAREAGIKWTAIKGPVPQETPAGRLRQMKSLFRRFSATIKNRSDKYELRPLARPLHEYSSPKQGVLQGILCGLTTNGTNPSVIIALEAVTPAEGKDAPKSWRYGVVCMTTLGVAVKLDKEEVFTKPIESLGDHDTATYFFEATSKK